MPNHSLEHVFHAMADPTRMAVLERLSQSDASTGELARPFAMALPSFLQHMRILEQSSLVRSRKEGRTRRYALEPATLQQAQHWLEQRRQNWESRLDRLDHYLTQQKDD